jgi:DnaJ-domain-containing protein 1
MTDTKRAIADVWAGVDVHATGFPAKDWLDKLDAAIRADERAIDREITRQLKERHRDIA